MKIERIKKSKLESINFDNLPFGKYFSDHMLMCEYQNDKWLEPYIKPYEHISISPCAQVFHYGQAFFEGMKAYKNQNDIFLFRSKDNLKRFNNSAKRLCMPEITEEIFINGIKKLINLDEKWIPEHDNSALYIRPFMIATEEYIKAMPSKKYLFMIATAPTGSYYDTKIDVKIEEYYSRSAQGGVGFTKAGGNYAGAFYPTKMVQQEGYTQLIWTDAYEHKYLEECGTMNIFFIIDNKIITPKLSDSILGGITRDSIIELARNKGYEVKESKISINELYKANDENKLTEVFGSGTAVTIGKIKSINSSLGKIKISSHEITEKLKKELLDIQYGRINDPFNWREKINKN